MQQNVIYLQARASWVYGQYGFVRFQNENQLRLVTQALIGFIQDKDQILSYKAGIALNFVFSKPETREIVRTNIDQLLGIYIKLINQIDNEQMVSAMEGIINHFKEDITPFALPLTQSLVQHFFRLQEKEEKEDDEGDAQMASSSLFGAVNTILQQKLSQEVVFQIIQALLPMINKGFIFDNEFVDETMETITIILQKLQAIPKELWFYYSCTIYMMIGINKSVVLEGVQGITGEQLAVLQEIREGWGTDILEKTLPLLKTFIQLDRQTFLNGTDFLGARYLDLLFELVDRCHVDEAIKNDCDQVEMVDSLHLFDCLIENNLSGIDSVVKLIFEKIITYFGKFYQESIPYYQLHLFNVIAMVMYYNVAFALELF